MHSHSHSHAETHTHDDHHGFGHHHAHAPTSFGAVFIVSILLNGTYIAGEVTWGLLAHSLSLLADAGHNLSDVLGLIAAWAAQTLAKKNPSQRFTYGLKRSTILTALTNASILLLVTGGIIWGAIWHLFYPETVHGKTISIVAFIGILINGGTALLLMKGSHHDLNMRGAFLHMASDALMAFAVVIAGFLITFTGLNLIDPIVSLLVSTLIIWGTWSLLKQSLDLALDAVPHNIDASAVEKALRQLPGVHDLHHLHIWPISTTETALTVHIVQENVPSTYTADETYAITHAILTQGHSLLQEDFHISHPTFQIEPSCSSNLGEHCSHTECSSSSHSCHFHAHNHAHSH